MKTEDRIDKALKTYKDLLIETTTILGEAENTSPYKSLPYILKMLKHKIDIAITKSIELEK